MLLSESFDTNEWRLKTMKYYYYYYYYHYYYHYYYYYYYYLNRVLLSIH